MLKNYISISILIFTGILCGFSPQTRLNEISKFDFLLGKWKLTWNDSLSGTKMVTKELDGCAVFENYFDDEKTGKYKANSYTVFHKYRQEYAQTMIDNQGNYLTFAGRWENDKMIFITSYKTPDSKIMMQRQVYYNIKPESIDWNWEASTDQGKNWKKEMIIHYQKIK